MFEEHETLTVPMVRLSPKKAPFRRANVHFATLEPVILAGHLLTGEQMLLLGQEPLVDVDVSMDDGDRWSRFELEPEAKRPPVTDAAHSPDRAVDPSGPIVPRAPIDTGDGLAAGPEAADPAVPLAKPAPVDGRPRHRGRGVAGEPGADIRDRPVGESDKGGAAPRA